MGGGGKEMGGRERRREGNGRKREEEGRRWEEEGGGNQRRNGKRKRGENEKEGNGGRGKTTQLGPVGTGFDLELLYGVNSTFSVASGVLATDQVTTLSLNLKIIVFIGCWRMGGPSLSIPRCTCNTSTLFAGR